MPVSHIGLTVSHLPTSCSFFLASLAPLGYRYIGQQGNQIGFGVENTDFFICEETPSNKPSATHIAFYAPSRSAVNEFFCAALKAGGRAHGEPTVRDSRTGYYSAAVLDFDNNSIEVMHRNENSTYSEATMGPPEAQRIPVLQENTVKGTKSSGVEADANAARVVVNNITTPTTVVSRSTFGPRSSNETTAKAIIGTLLGVAAGAAVAYALTRDEAQSTKIPNPQPVTHRVTETPRPLITKCTAHSPPSCSPSGLLQTSHPVLRELEYVCSPATTDGRSLISHHTAGLNRLPSIQFAAGPPHPSTLIDTFVPPSEIPRFQARPTTQVQAYGDSHPQARSEAPADVSGLTNSRSKVFSATKTLSKTNLESLQHPSIPSHAEVARLVSLPDSKATSAVSAKRSPLPDSRATSAVSARRLPLLDSKASSAVSAQDPTSRYPILLGGLSEEIGSIKGSVAPSDSVSQAGSKRSKHSRHSHHHETHAAKERRAHRSGGSQASARTDKESSEIRAGRKQENATHLTLRPASKASVHRSVMSFIAGM